MTSYTFATTINDLKDILKLQKANLAQVLRLEEIEKQGFVSVNHSYDQLKKLNDHEKHIIAKDSDKLIGYILAMTQQSKFEIPMLCSMFNVFDSVLYAGKKVNDYNYLVVGQVCIDKDYRGLGIFDKCYAAYKKYYSEKYDFAITEIVSTNHRSLNAHKRIGFKEINSYLDLDNTNWMIVIWDWKKD